MRKVISAALVVMMLVSLFSISVSAETPAVKGWQDDVKTIGVALTDAAEFNILGHWMAKDNFVKASDWYESGKEVYMQRIAPVDNEGTMQTFAMGEHIVFNYELYKTEAFDLLAENVEVAAYLFGAEKKEGETGEFKLLNEYRGYKSAVSGVVEAPYDNFVAAFVFVVENAELAEFGSFVTISANDKGYLAVEENGTVDFEKGLEVDIADEKLPEVILPNFSTYAIAKAAAYKMEFADEIEIGNYVAKLSTEDVTGFRAYFVDENYDVINQVVITGAEEQRVADLKMNVMVPGTYYLVVAGNNLDSKGTVKATFEVLPKAEATVSIDLAAQTADVELTEGEYEIVGENNNVKLVIAGGAYVYMNNATVGGILLVNNDAPVVINAKGVNYVNAQANGYGITNAEDANSGLYVIGDVLKVSSTAETKGAVLMHDAPLHIDTIEFIVKADKVEGYYPVGIWVVGKNLPHLTLNKDITINHGLAVSYIMYSQYFAAGMTVSAETTDHACGFADAAVDFVLSKYQLGDVNLDKVVDTLDVTMVLQYCADMVELSDVQLFMGDVNYDLKVNTADAVVLLKYIAQIITEF